MSERVEPPKLEWARLDSGTVRHLVMPALSPHLAFCGQYGEINMDIEVILVFGREMERDPSTFKECSRCLAKLSDLLPPHFIRAITQEIQRQNRSYSSKSGRDGTQGRGSVARKAARRAAAGATGLPHR